MGDSLPVFYNCHNCPAFCCSYSRIEVTKKDIKRLAKHFGVSVAEATERFTMDYEPGETVLRHQKDKVYGTVCQFLDTESRACTIHPSRPEICREHPGQPTCAYYAFLMSERAYQHDDEHIARAYNPADLWVPLD